MIFFNQKRREWPLALAQKPFFFKPKIYKRMNILRINNNWPTNIKRKQKCSTLHIIYWFRFDSIFIFFLSHSTKWKKTIHKKVQLFVSVTFFFSSIYTILHIMYHLFHVVIWLFGQFRYVTLSLYFFMKNLNVRAK